MLDLFGPGDVGNVNKSVDAFFKLNERAEISKIADLAVDLGSDRIAFLDRVPRIFLELLHAEADAFFFRIDAEDLNLNFVAADGIDVFGLAERFDHEISET